MTVLSADALLEVRGLKTSFPIRSGVLRRVRGAVRAVDGVDLTIYPGETLALVGESGCGKTTVGRSLLRLVEPTGGNIWLGGVNLTRLSRQAFKSYRQKMQIVMQDPGAALDPRLTVRDAIAEGMEAFGIGANAEVRTQRVADLMRRVSLDPELMWRYPHEFSGGQRQRICIARALAVEPVLLICDEATSALDVSIQAQILNLLGELKAERGLTYLFITHDLGVVRYFADRVAVMYLGRIVELGKTERIFAEPMHPYTKALLASIPSLDPERRRLAPMALGDVPSPAHPPSGCHFHPRCSVRLELCSQYEPPVVPLPDGLSRCVLAHASRAGDGPAPAPASGADGAAAAACCAGTQTRKPRQD
jgi:peptide/nickel transport system ATP-binding protein